MPTPCRLEIPEPQPPHRLVADLPAGLRAHVLEARAPEGWGTGIGGVGVGLSLLGVEPEIELRGDVRALDAGQRWLDAAPGRPPLDRVLIGALSYDLGRAFETLPEATASTTDCPEPPVYLAGFRALYVYQPDPRRGWIVGSDPAAMARLADIIRDARPHGGHGLGLRLRTPRHRSSDLEFLSGVRAIVQWIIAGDVYQVNLSRRLEIPDVDRRQVRDLYAGLTMSCGAPFSALIEAGDFCAVSNSPERFLRVAGGRIETCPIKGTRPRGRTPEEDRLLARELLHSPKDRAEHLMIVDLERNDLGRLCRTGSVEVHRIAALRSFSHVHHLVASVRGDLVQGDREGKIRWDALLAATYPGGSITGAPKLRAMEIIEDLEPVRRGLYTGSIGYFDASGGLDLSIAIRTAVLRGDELHLQLGSGIVGDSDPDEELRETRQKGLAFASHWGAAR